MPHVTVRLFAGAAQACAVLVAAVPAAAVAALLWASIRSGISVDLPALGAFGTAALFSLGVAATAAVIGGVLGIGCAVAAEELAAGPARAVIEAAIAFLGVTPAVVYGWFAIVLVVPFVDRLSSGAMAAYAGASAVLTAMVVPTACGLVTRAMREIPDEVRQAAAAAGASRLQTTAFVIIPALRGRIRAALAAALARAIGEATALQILFAYLVGISVVPPTAASLMFWTVVHVQPETIASAVWMSALALLVVVIVCASFVDREYREMQWA
jgi:ABC-type phosphate transport system permease subunit